MQTLCFMIFKLEHALRKHILTFVKNRHFSRFSQTLPPDMKAKHGFLQTWFRVPAANCRSVFMFCIIGLLKKLNIALKILAKETHFHSFLVVPSRSQSVGVIINFVKTVTDVVSYSVGGVSKRRQKMLQLKSPLSASFPCIILTASRTFQGDNMQ